MEAGTASPLGADVLATVIEVTPTPLWVIGADGAVALANQAALDLLGYRSADDVLGAPSHDTLHEWRPDGSRYLPHACPIMDDSAPGSTAPEWFLTRNGRPIPVTWTARPLGADGTRLLSFAAARADDLPPVTAAPSRAGLRARLLTHVGARFRDPEFTPAALAAEIHLSLRTVQQLLAEDGRSPATEIRRHRLELARSLLAGGASVGQACRASGFAEAGTFHRAFKRRYGVPPSAWARPAPRPGESPAVPPALPSAPSAATPATATARR